MGERAPVHGELSIKTRRLQTVTLIAVQGEVDLANFQTLGSVLGAAVGGDSPVLLDLTKVRYIDSTGLGLLLRMHEDCHAKRIPFVVAANPLVRRICNVLSLQTVVPIFDHVRSARAHLEAVQARHGQDWADVDASLTTEE